MASETSKSGMEKLLGLLASFQSWVSIICFVFMSVFVLAGVVMRFVLQIPFSWGEEISRYLMVVAVTLGIGMGVREKAHLGVAMAVDAAPARIGRVMKIIAYGINTFGYLFLACVSYEFTEMNREFGQESPALALPMWMMYAVMMLGFFLSALESVVGLIGFLRAGREEPIEPDREEQHLY